MPEWVPWAITTAFIIGSFFGSFMLRFISRKECGVNQELLHKRVDDTRDRLHERIDAIQNVLTGGAYVFEVRLVPKKS